MSKSEIFATIRKGLKRGAARKIQLVAVEDRIDINPCHTIPLRAKGTHRLVVDKFIEMAKLAACEVVCCDSMLFAADEIVKWLKLHNINALRCSRADEVQSLKWPKKCSISFSTGTASISDKASLTDALAGIAETGTLLLNSCVNSPTLLAFLPEFHLVVLKKTKIIGSYEDGWDILKQKFPEKLPRNVNLITGPSRSADIEQTLLMGAHGPKELVIFLVDE